MEKQCKYCLEIFNVADKNKGWMANHTRWCEKNPKRSEYVDNLTNVRSHIDHTKEGSNQFTKAKRLGYEIESSLKGRKGKSIPHTEETKLKMRNSALKSTHRRLKKNPIMYNGVLMDSKWEVELAKRLDHLEIKWIRPTPLKWEDKNGMSHNYFPDFYLIEYDLYLDPKNPHAYSMQIEKIEILNITYNNIVWLKTIEECKEFKI